MRTTGFTYDALDMYPATTTNALGHTSSVTVHPALGVVLDSRDPNGIVPATMKYDRFGRVREVNYADGYFERHSAFGLLARVTVVPDGSGGTITAQSTVLDRLGRPTDRTVPAFEGGGCAGAVARTYDRLGRVATISQPRLSRFRGSPPEHDVCLRLPRSPAEQERAGQRDHAARIHRPGDPHLRRQWLSQLRPRPRGRSDRGAIRGQTRDPQPLARDQLRVWALRTPAPIRRGRHDKPEHGVRRSRPTSDMWTPARARRRRPTTFSENCATRRRARVRRSTSRFATCSGVPGVSARRTV